MARQERLKQNAEREQAAVAIRPLSILVVDDNLDAAHTLAALLEINGHQVAVAENANAALA
ncbi:hypothetical protein, partial [Bradyrhizobium cosmicum]|uniref:hypothetical protein n=1 Tax=Bradyrhizobium cosmicum TaxID=1404864 RepID=UPI0028E97A98